MINTGSGKWEKIAVISVALLVGLGVIYDQTTRTRMRQEQAQAHVVQLLTGIQSFATVYGSFPKGDNAAIMAALGGKNERLIIFFEAPAESFNDRGELVDGWGKPVRFDLSDPANPRIWSTGRNRRDDQGADGSDDIPSWK